MLVQEPNGTRPICRVCDHGPVMPRIFPKGPVATGVFVYGLWQRLTPAQRRVLLEAARRHGPKVAAATLAAAKTTRRKP